MCRETLDDSCIESLEESGMQTMLTGTACCKPKQVTCNGPSTADTVSSPRSWGFRLLAAVCRRTCQRALLGSRCRRKRDRETPQTPSPTWRALLAVSPLAGPEVDRLPLQRLGLEGLLEHVAHHVGTDVGIPQVGETCSPVERACRWLAHAVCSGEADGPAVICVVCGGQIKQLPGQRA